MKRFTLLGLLLFVGCSKAPVDSVPAVSPTPVAITEKPAAPTIRPRFRTGLETFITETRVLSNLATTGASNAGMQEQLNKVQQAAARVDDPRDDIETKLYKRIKMITFHAELFVATSRLRRQVGESSLGTGDTESDVELLKDSLHGLEDDLDKILSGSDG